MDQGVFFDVGEFDRSKVDLNKVPTSAQEYLRQMIVGREKCPEIVTVNLDKDQMKHAKDQVPKDPSKGLACQWAPDKEWAVSMVCVLLF